MKSIMTSRPKMSSVLGCTIVGITTAVDCFLQTTCTGRTLRLCIYTFYRNFMVSETKKTKTYDISKGHYFQVTRFFVGVPTKLICTSPRSSTCDTQTNATEHPVIIIRIYHYYVLLKYTYTHTHTHTYTTNIIYYLKNEISFKILNYVLIMMLNIISITNTILRIN